MISFEDVKNNEDIKTYITQANESLGALGYTEHSFAHVTKVAEDAGNILKKLGYSEREQEIAMIAAYMHDIGNVINRVDHAQSGALMTFRILRNLGMPACELSAIISAIGNHDEATAAPVNAVAAALILADKSDVRRSRVRNNDPATFDIHDRVNYAVSKSSLSVSRETGDIILKLSIDISISPVMSYFEIFLGRMLLCRKAAEFLGKNFNLMINGQKLL